MLERPLPSLTELGMVGDRGSRMDAIVFLLILVAAVAAIRARRTWVVPVTFTIAFVFALALFLHHATDALKVSL